MSDAAKQPPPLTLAIGPNVTGADDAAVISQTHDDDARADRVAEIQARNAEAAGSATADPDTAFDTPFDLEA